MGQALIVEEGKRHQNGGGRVVCAEDMERSSGGGAGGGGGVAHSIPPTRSTLPRLRLDPSGHYPVHIHSLHASVYTIRVCWRAVHTMAQFARGGTIPTFLTSSGSEKRGRSVLWPSSLALSRECFGLTSYCSRVVAWSVECVPVHVLLAVRFDPLQRTRCCWRFFSVHMISI